jgi:ectoine hydroxylase-related dioxygenase (phytanoyl-CoA dioxygenase family)
MAGDTARRLEELTTEGYTVIPGFLDEAALAEVRQGLAPHLGSFSGRNDFEGEKTERVYTLVARAKVFERIAEDERILAILDQVLQPNYLLTASQAICIHPGETPQPFHADDSFYPIPRPRPMVSLSVIVAIDAFTAENGGTEIIPRSHQWSDDEVRGIYYLGGNAPTADPEARLAPLARPCVLAAGSAIVFSGMLIHRGGANRSNAPRLAITNQYCQPWARTQENFFLGVPAEIARRMSPRLQSLLGYNIHPPFMGHVTARHPLKALEPGYVPPVG